MGGENSSRWLARAGMGVVVRERGGVIATTSLAWNACRKSGRLHVVREYAFVMTWVWQTRASLLVCESMKNLKLTFLVPDYILHRWRRPRVKATIDGSEIPIYPQIAGHSAVKIPFQLKRVAQNN